MKGDRDALTLTSKERLQLVFNIVLNTTEGRLYCRHFNSKENEKSLTNVREKQVDKTKK